jgi:hypothetical protein
MLGQSKEEIMRFLLLGLFIGCTAASAVGQCPIQPLKTSVDASGKNVAIRYYNSGTRPVRDVQFILTTEDTRPAGQSTPKHFSARGVLRPKQERVAVFSKPDGMALIGTVEVVRVSFSDLSTWKAPHDNPCKVQFAEQ